MSNKLESIRKIKLDLSNVKEKNKFEDYPWEECVADQIARYGDEETAKKVCGAIKAGMKKTFQEGDSLENACWPGYEAIGLKEGPNGNLVPNCVPVKEEQSKVVKQGFVIPSPEGGEDENTFISRCMKEIYNEYGEEQSAAICYSKWREK